MRGAFKILIAYLAMAWLASAAGAYIVFLKDGTQIQTREKYRIEGDRAILVLPSGTETFYPADEIDIARTEEVNRTDLGSNTTLIEGIGESDLASAPVEDEDTLDHLISRRRIGLRLPEPTRRTQETSADPDALPQTVAGYVNLLSIRRRTYPHADVAGELMAYFKGQGTDGVRVFQGTAGDRPLVEIIANSEASVFKALEDAASGLVQIRESFPGRVAAFDLLLLTESRMRAGQFSLTPELATLLVAEELSPPAFFLRYVEF